ncbi:MAG: acyl-CoA dehydratase activase [Clostridiales bacterium]|nr:acyl-CoA dehydratase activase [Clostridiales bacterium]
MHVIGVDIGSSCSKAVAVNLEGCLIAKAVVNLGTGTSGISRALEALYANYGLSPDERVYTMATGYGRNSFTQADGQISELSCHAKGIHSILPTVRTIIDIGGQDSKAINIDDKGNLLQFTMNDKCAAGTGRFLETMSRVLDVPLSEFGNVSSQATKSIFISNTCTVFAESEVVSSLSAGCHIEDIIAGIHESVAKKAASLAFRNAQIPDFCLTGGVAQNQGMVKALREALEIESLLVPPDPRITGALGAALFGLQKYKKFHR